MDREALLAMSSEDLLRLWVDTRDETLRDLLIERHLPDVVETARWLSMRLPRSVDVDDLCNAGCSGLLRCLETFDASKGRPFQSYLRTRAYGSMVDELRAMDWLPRLMRSRLAQRDQVVEALRQDLGREPSADDVASALGIDVQEYRRSYPSVAPQLGLGLADGGEDFERLDASIVGLGFAGRAPGDEAHPLTALYHQELMARIQHLLSPTEWLLVELHYFQGLNLREVADRLDLSPARICQIHGRVLARLKERLREEAATI
jgi:RNA polymerase sigma factor for flagellar operon FliA